MRICIQDPEAQQKKLKLKQAMFEEERKKKNVCLQPVFIGPLWHGSDPDEDALIKQNPYYKRWVAHQEPIEALLCARNPSFVFTSFQPPPTAAAAKGNADKSAGGGADGFSSSSIFSCRR